MAAKRPKPDPIDALERDLRALEWPLGLEPLVGEFVNALRDSAIARECGEGAELDRCVNRAVKLADVLVLTPRAEHALGRTKGNDGDDGEAEDPLEQLARDEVAAARSRRANRP